VPACRPCVRSPRVIPSSLFSHLSRLQKIGQERTPLPLTRFAAAAPPNRRSWWPLVAEPITPRRAFQVWRHTGPAGVVPDGRQSRAVGFSFDSGGRPREAHAFSGPRPRAPMRPRTCPMASNFVFLSRSQEGFSRAGPQGRWPRARNYRSTVAKRCLRYHVLSIARSGRPELGPGSVP